MLDMQLRRLWEVSLLPKCSAYIIRHIIGTESELVSVWSSLLTNQLVSWDSILDHPKEKIKQHTTPDILNFWNSETSCFKDEIWKWQYVQLDTDLKLTTTSSYNAVRIKARKRMRVEILMNVLTRCSSLWSSECAAFAPIADSVYVVCFLACAGPRGAPPQSGCEENSRER